MFKYIKNPIFLSSFNKNDEFFYGRNLLWKNCNSEELQIFNKSIMREMPIAVNKASVQKNSKILIFVIENKENPHVFKSIGQVDHINIISKHFLYILKLNLHIRRWRRSCRKY